MSPKAIDGLDVVIVDVLRATTTIAFCVSQGASVVTLAKDADALARASELGASAILAGEHMGHRLEGFHCNNSPTELGRYELAGKTVIMVTTNGTQAIAACDSAHRIFAGALTNAPALARFLSRQGLERDVAIVCAGRNTGALASEDLLGAGAIVTALADATDAWFADGAGVVRELFAHHRDDIAGAIARSDAAKELVEKGYAADVAVCSTLGSVDDIALFREGAFTSGVDHLPS